MATKVIAVILIAGLLVMFCGLAYAAEQREPFKWALVMALPAKPQEVRHLFDSETACQLDLASSANAAPAGTVFQCQRRK